MAPWCASFLLGLASLLSISAQEGVLVLDYDFNRNGASSLRAAPFSFGSSYTIEGQLILSHGAAMKQLIFIQAGIFLNLVPHLPLYGILVTNLQVIVRELPWKQSAGALHFPCDFTVSLGFNRDENLEFCVRTSPSKAGITCLTMATRVATNLWNHVAVTYEAGSSTARIYIDGLLQAAASGILATPTVQRKLHIFGSHPVLPVTGISALLDDIRVWSEARSGVEVRTWLGADLLAAPAAERVSLEVMYTFDSALTGNRGRETADALGSSRKATVDCAFLEDSCLVQLPTNSKSVCGDGKRGAAEQCDDGNVSGGDGCSPLCVPEASFLCFQGTPGGTDLCVAATSLDAQTLDQASAVTSAWTLQAGSRPGAEAAVSADARFDGQGGVRLHQPRMYPKPSVDTFPKNGLAAWLRAGEGVTTVAGHVTRWADQSGSGHDMVFPGTANFVGPKVGPPEEFDLNKPFIRFERVGSRQILEFEDNDFEVRKPFSLVSMWRQSDRPAGRLMVARNGNNFLFGPNSNENGYHNDGSGWIRWRRPGSGDRSRGYERTLSGRWYAMAAVIDSQYSAVYRYGRLAAIDSERTSNDIGKMALGDHPDAGHGSPVQADLMELAIFNRTLSEAELRDVHNYYAEEYGLAVSNAIDVARDLFAANPADYTSYFTRVLSGSITPSTYLRMNVKAEKIPRRWGMPLWIGLMEDAGGAAPQPWQCTSRDVCAGSRFYSICFGGGSSETMHCDEVRESNEGEWEVILLHVVAKFSGKYRAEFSAGNLFNPVASLRLMAATVASDDEAEGHVDEVQLFTLDSLSSCTEVSVVSVGSNSYASHVLKDRPLQYMRLDTTVGLAFETVSGTSGSSNAGPPIGASGPLTGQPDETDMGASFILPGTQFVLAPSPPRSKVEEQSGFGVEFWFNAPMGSPATVAGEWAPIVSDRDGAGWTFYFELSSDMRLRFGVNTHLGAAWREMTTPLVGTLHYVSGTWDAVTGNLELFVDGTEPAVTKSSYNSNLYHKTLGFPSWGSNQLRIGWDGVWVPAIGGRPLDIDEVAVFDRYMPRQTFASRWHRTRLDRADNPLLDDGGVTPASMAKVVVGGVATVASSNGLAVWVLDAAGAISSSDTFSIMDDNSTTAEAEIARARSWLLSDASVPQGSAVAAALKWPAVVRPKYEYFDDFESPLLYRITDSRVVRSPSAAAYESRPVRNYYWGMDDLPEAERSWTGAKDYCENVRGERMCTYDDVCRNIRYRSDAVPKSPNMGTYAGEGWLPVADEDNLWISVGSGYVERQCRTYEWVANNVANFPYPQTAKPTWSVAPPSSAIACCGRVGYDERWVHEPEYPTDVSTWNLDHEDPWFQHHTDAMRSHSYYMARPKSGPNNAFWTSSTNSVSCTHRHRGTYLWLNTTESRQWTDFTMELDLYVHVRSVGIVFRHQSPTEHYKFIFSTYNVEYCSGFSWFDGADNDRADTNLNNFENRIWRDRDHLQVDYYEWVSLRLDAYGNKFDVYINGRLINSWTDPNNRHPAGSIGFFTVYNAYAQFRNLRIYNKKPVDMAPLDSALISLGMPPMPTQAQGVSQGPDSRFATGASYAALGRKSLAFEAASGVNSYLSHSRQTGREQVVSPRPPLNMTYDENTLPLGQRPAAKTKGPGDGAAIVTTVLGCRQQTITIPENAAVGSLLPVPVLSSASLHGAANNFRVAGIEADVVEDETEFGLLTPLRGSVFGVTPEDGVITVRKNVLDFESKPTHTVSVTAGSSKYDSGWFTMISGCPDNLARTDHADCFRELEFPDVIKREFATRDPSMMDVEVTLRVADGPNQGFVFKPMGAAPWAMYTTWSTYGGMVAGYNRTHVRLWAPSTTFEHNGAAINLGGGSGAFYGEGSADFLGEKNVQVSHLLEVRVVVVPAPPADYDSQWFALNAQNGFSSSKLLLHGLADYPSRVKVVVRSVDGANTGYVFEAKGDGQKYRHYGEYGGVVYIYDEVSIRVLAPEGRQSESLSMRGHAIHIPLGYPDAYRQESMYSEVRVMAWSGSAWEPPAYSTNPNAMSFVRYSGMYGEQPLALPSMLRPAGRVEALAFVDNIGGTVGRVPLIGMHGNLAYTYWSQYSGIAWARNRTGVRAWGPGPDITRAEWRSTNHVPVRASDGWGGEYNAWFRDYARTQTFLWEQPQSIQDATSVTINVADLQEPPRTANSYFSIFEDVSERSASLGECVGTIIAADDDVGDTLSFSIIGGNTNAAWNISSSGEVCVANAMAINFELQPFFVLVVSVFDGIFSNIAVAEIEVVNRNDQVHVFPKNLTIPENSFQNTILRSADPTELDEAVRSTDEDLDQTIFYSIVGGNTDGAFTINACSGQVRVNRTIINFEELNFYNLTVRVEDDGSPSTFAETWVTIHVTDANDPPTYQPTTLTVDENSLAGAYVGELLADDEDNDTLHIDILFGDSRSLFEVREVGLEPVTQRLRYGIFLSDNVVSWGDGTGREDTGFVCPMGCVNGTGEVLNFEGAGVPGVGPTGRGFNLQLRVKDLPVVLENLPNHIATDVAVVGFNDVNDPPYFDLVVRSVEENSPHGASANAGLTDCTASKPCARDDDAGDAGGLTFALLNPTEVPFTVSSTGNILVNLAGSWSNINFEETALFVLQVRVTDAGGPDAGGVQYSQTRNVTVQIVNVAEAPVIADGFAFSVSELAPLGFVINTLNATDEDTTDVVTYEIDGSSSTFDVIGSNGALTVVGALDFETESFVQITVFATDGTLESAHVTVNITILDENDPPVFQCSSLTNNVDFERVSDTTAVGNLVSGANEIADGFARQVFDLRSAVDDFSEDDCRIACESATDFDCAAATYFSSAYPFASFHSDCYGRTPFDNIRITDPVLQQGAVSFYAVEVCEEQVNLPENPAVGFVVATMAPVDLEGATPTLSLPAVNNPGYGFRVNGFDIEVNNTEVFNFEASPKLLVRVDASDGFSSASTWVRVTLTDVNEPPAFVGDNSTYSFGAAELDVKGTLVGRVLATDPDMGAVLTYSIVGGNDRDTFEIFNEGVGGTAGRIELNRTILSNEADTEGAGFNLDVMVSDGSLNDVVRVFVTINATNTSPMVTGLTPVTNLNEDGMPGDVFGPVLTASDNENDDVSWTVTSVTPVVAGFETAALFDIIKTSKYDARLRIAPGAPAAAFNFECSRVNPVAGCQSGAYHQFDLTIVVSDWGTGNRSTQLTTQVQLVQVNDVPRAPLFLQLQVPELSSVGTTLLDVFGSLSSPPAQLGSLADFYDDEKLPLTFALSGADSSVFAVAPGNGTLVVSSGNMDNFAFSNQYPAGQTPHLTTTAVLDFETKFRYNFILTVTDSVIATPLEVNVTVEVTDVREAPVVDSGLFEPFTFVSSVLENSPANALAGSLMASDPDGDRLYFSIAGVTSRFQGGCPVPEDCVEQGSAGQFLETFLLEADAASNATFAPLQAQGASMRLRQPQPGQGNSVIDFEQRVFYQIQVTISDRAPGLPNALLARAVLNVTVQDVNDVSIVAVRTTRAHASTPNVFVPTSGLRTVGGLDYIEIEGAGIEHTYPSNTPPVVSVQYGCSNEVAAAPASIGDDPFTTTCKYTATNCESVFGDTVDIRCEAAAGSGAQHRVRISVDGQVRHSQPAVSTAQAPQVVSYLPPTVTTVSAPASIPTTGGVVVVLTGTNFGPTLTPVSMVYGNGLLRFSGQACSISAPHVSISCTLVPGVGTGHVSSVTVDGLASPSIASILAAVSGSAQGAAYVANNGLNFSPPVVTGVQAASAGAQNAQQTSGSGSSRSIALTGSNFGPGTASLMANNMDPGAAFAAVMSYVSFTAELRNSRFWIQAGGCRYESQTLVRCGHPAGVGTDYTWNLRTGAQTSAFSTPPQTTGFAPPSMLDVFGEGVEEGPTAGNSRVTVRGLNLGPRSIVSRLDAAGNPLSTFQPIGAIDWLQYNSPSSLVSHITYTAQDCIIRSDHTVMDCRTAPGTGSGHLWTVSVGDQVSAQFTPAVNTSYATPFITETLGEAAPAAQTEGGQSIILRGSNLGPFNETIASVVLQGYDLGDRTRPQRRYDFTSSCFLRKAHEELQCTTPEGAGAFMAFDINIDGLQSRPAATRYLQPRLNTLVTAAPSDVVRSVTPTTLHTRGGDSIIISGANFAEIKAYVTSVRYFGSYDLAFGAARSVEYEIVQNCALTRQHEELQCITAPGVGATLEVDVSVAGQSKDGESIALPPVAYAPPVLMDLLPHEALRSVPGQVFRVPTPLTDTRSVASLPTEPTPAGGLRLVGTDFGSESAGLQLTAQVSNGDPSMPSVRSVGFSEVNCFQDFRQQAVGNGSVVEWTSAGYTLAALEGLYMTAVGASLGVLPQVGGEVPQDMQSRSAPYCVDFFLPVSNHESVTLTATAGGQQTVASAAFSFAPPHVGDVVVSVSDQGNITANVASRARAAAGVSGGITSKQWQGYRMLKLEGHDFGSSGAVVVQTVQLLSANSTATSDSALDLSAYSAQGVLLQFVSEMQSLGLCCAAATSDPVADCLQECIEADGASPLSGEFYNANLATSAIAAARETTLCRWELDVVAEGLIPAGAEADDPLKFEYQHGSIRCLLPPVAGEEVTSAVAVLAAGYHFQAHSNVIDFSQLSPEVLRFQDLGAGGLFRTMGGQRLQAVVEYAGTRDRNATTIRVGSESVPFGGRAMRDVECPIDWLHPQAFVELDDDEVRCETGSPCIRSRELAILTCIMPPGEGVDVPLRVYRGSRRSQPETVSYAAPTIDSIVPMDPSADLVAGFPAFDTAGGSLAWLQGRNLGLVNRSLTWVWGTPLMPLAGNAVTRTNASALNTFDLGVGVLAVAAGAGANPWERIPIVIPANGIGKGHSACLLVAGQSVCASSALFNYKAPSVSYTIGFEQVPTRGSPGLLWVVGNNFGPSFPSNSTWGNATVQYPESAIRAAAAARRLQTTPSQKVWLGGVPRPGQGVEHVFALGVGTDQFTIETAMWNHTHIAFRVQESAGGVAVHLGIFVAGQLWESDAPPAAGQPPLPGSLTLLNFAVPSIDQSASSDITALDTRGQIQLTVRGANFGVSPTIRLGSQLIPVDAGSHDFVNFTLPEGLGRFDLQVFAADQPIGSPLNLVYAPAVAQPFRVVRGFTQVQLGSVLGGEETTGLYTTPCEENSLFLGTVSMENFDDWRERVTADTPSWDRARRCSQPDRIEIRGVNFGPPSSDPLQGAVVFFDGMPVNTTCASIDGPGAFKPMRPCIMAVLPQERHTLLKVRAPPGQGMGHTIQVQLPQKVNGVSTGGVIALPAQTIHYLPARVRSQNPSPFLATGSEVFLFGHGFGHNHPAFPRCADGDNAAALPDPSVLGLQFSGEFNCTRLCWSGVNEPSQWALPPVGVNDNGLPYLKCELGVVTAGFHSIAMTVDGVHSDNIDLEDGNTQLRAFCEKAWWGLQGEYCMRCLQGGVCENCALPDWRFLQCPQGFRSEGEDCAALPQNKQGPFCNRPTTQGGEPVAYKGFWKENISNSTADFFDEDVCDPRRQDRSECPLLLGCIPAFACVGNNTCEEGYVDERCSNCKPFEYFRIAGICKKCPDNPWMPIVGFIMVIIVMCGGSWYVNKKNLSLGMVAIGIDYFQVLAIFAQSNVKWPTLLLDFFNVFSYITFNIDVAAPECLTPNLDFRLKWYMQLGLPIGVAAMLMTSFFTLYLYKKFVLGQSGRVLTAHLSPSITAMVTAMYVLYLLLCRRVFDVFNCNPPVPPDPRGTTYMEATNSPCWEPGSLHMQVIPFAIFGLCFYVIGYPVFVGYFLFKFRETVKEDQHLRAIGMNYVASSMSSNIGAIFRARYSKLYYYFKPSHYWFVLTVLARKVFLAMTSLMFRSNPGFQLAVALLIVFFSFTASVIAQPYLCAATADEVIAKHDKMVELGSRLHQKIDVELRRAQGQQRADKLKSKTLTWTKAKEEAASKKEAGSKVGKQQEEAQVDESMVETGHLPQNTKADGSTMMAGSTLVNYNLVDQILLANTVLVCLIGLMFESEQFSGSTDDAGAVGALTGWAIFLIMSGTIFYMVCFGIDLYANLGSNRSDSICARMEAQKREHGSLRKALIKRFVTSRKYARQAEKAKSGKGKGKGKDAGVDALIAARNKASEDKEDAGGGLMMNPMLMSAGAAANSAAAMVARLSEKELQVANMPSNVPPDAVYRAYVKRYLAMESEIAELGKDFGDSGEGKRGPGQ